MAVGLPALLLGGAIWLGSDRYHGLGILISILGLALTAGSALQILRVAQSRRRFPAAGKRVDIGGYRIHVLAEGEARGAYPVVWFGGGHAAGATMDHLHRRLRVLTRSILIDRPGTGWSDIGPFPRSTSVEAEEMVSALAAAGEAGPFVFVGYSFGGLLAANIARRHPALVARLVLLDATPLETILLGPKLGVLRQMRRDALWSGLLRSIGIPANIGMRRVSREARHRESGRQFERELGPALDALRAVEIRAGHQLAGWSSFLDLHGPSIADRGWELSVYDGDLGDLPVWVVAPRDSSEVRNEREVAAATDEQDRMLRFFARSRERYMATSTASRRIVTPPGTTHQFVYEAPEFVAELIAQAIELKPEERASEPVHASR